jgi:hypothetical protein
METEVKKGIESLQQSIKKDCAEFSPEKLHSEKCRYCPRYFWVLERAAQYAKVTKTTVETIIEAWEKTRNYWYLNFYQECNQPDLEKTKVEVIAYDDWRKELTDKFGEEPKLWKFKCVQCGNVQCVQDFIDAEIKDPESKVYFSCLGRWVKDKGCDWTLGGLFSIQKRMVISPELNLIPVFETA